MVEIMIVVSIIAIVVAAGIPMMWKAMQKDDLARAVNDIMEGCKAARERAILSGTPFEFVIHEKGDLLIAAAPNRKKASGGASTSDAKPNLAATGSLMPAFPRKLGENVVIQLIDVNFVDYMDQPEARVRFYPNGTSDEFSVVLNDKGVQRTITLDIVTGIPDELVK